LDTIKKLYQWPQPEIISSLLLTLGTDGGKIIEIQYKSGLSYRRLKSYLNFLIQSGLVIYLNEESNFKIMQKGRRALEAHTELDKLMIRPRVFEQDCRSEYPFVNIPFV
jgi:predicted transcriptional regulator